MAELWKLKMEEALESIPEGGISPIGLSVDEQELEDYEIGLAQILNEEFAGKDLSDPDNQKDYQERVKEIQVQVNDYRKFQAERRKEDEAMRRNIELCYSAYFIQANPFQNPPLPKDTRLAYDTKEGTSIIVNVDFGFGTGKGDVNICDVIKEQCNSDDFPTEPKGIQTNLLTGGVITATYVKDVEHLLAEGLISIFDTWKIIF